MIIKLIKSHAPVISIFIVITAFTLLRQWMWGSWNSMLAMSDFMAGFFLIFGSFKLFNLKGFVSAFSKYNIVAEHFRPYAFAVPFIQIGLGIAYLFHIHPLIANGINFIIMSIGFISVLIKLIKKDIIPCACLGTLLQHPLSLMSLFEQLLMVVMSLSMTLHHYVLFTTQM